MLTSVATVTAHCGPHRQLTAGVFLNVTEYNVDLPRAMVTFKSNGLYKEFDLYDIATFTNTIANGLHTVVISQ
jgi:hypothetical protein